MNNDAYKSKYMKYKTKYLELKEMLGGAAAEKYVVGMRVKRVKGDDDVYADGSIHRAEALGKYGIIKKIEEEREWPPGSGKMLPKTYSIDFKNHYEGTKYEGVLINVIEDDLEPAPLVPKYGRLMRHDDSVLEEKFIEVPVDGKIALLPLYKIGVPIKMFNQQILQYNLRPKYGRLIDAKKNTIMISETPGFEGYTFEVDIIREPYAKNSIYKITRLS